MKAQSAAVALAPTAYQMDVASKIRCFLGCLGPQGWNVPVDIPLTRPAPEDRPRLAVESAAIGLNLPDGTWLSRANRECGEAID
jgi:hypothetical protein